jgi:hypothetical protein
VRSGGLASLVEKTHVGSGCLKYWVVNDNGEGGTPVLGNAQHRLSVALESEIFLASSCS